MINYSYASYAYVCLWTSTAWYRRRCACMILYTGTRAHEHSTSFFGGRGVKTTSTTARHNPPKNGVILSKRGAHG